MHSEINEERDQEPKVTFGGATDRLISFTHSSPNQTEVGVPADQPLSPWTHHQRVPGTSLLLESPRRAAAQAGALLTENDDHAVLDGLDFCL